MHWCITESIRSCCLLSWMQINVQCVNKARLVITRAAKRCFKNKQTWIGYCISLSINSFSRNVLLNFYVVFKPSWLEDNGTMAGGAEISKSQIKVKLCMWIVYGCQIFKYLLLQIYEVHKKWAPCKEYDMLTQLFSDIPILSKALSVWCLVVYQRFKPGIPTVR